MMPGSSPNDCVIHNATPVVHDETQLSFPPCESLDVATHYFLDEFHSVFPVPIDLGEGVGVV